MGICCSKPGDVAQPKPAAQPPQQQQQADPPPRVQTVDQACGPDHFEPTVVQTQEIQTAPPPPAVVSASTSPIDVELPAELQNLSPPAQIETVDSPEPQDPASIAQRLIKSGRYQKAEQLLEELFTRGNYTDAAVVAKELIKAGYFDAAEWLAFELFKVPSYKNCHLVARELLEALRRAK